MSFFKFQAFPATLLLILSGFLAACQPTPTLAVPTSSGIGVGITDDLCPTVVIQVGHQVSWTNQGNDEHVVRDITVEGQPLFDSGTLKRGDSFTFTFSDPNTYTYECSVDGSLTATITVQP